MANSLYYAARIGFATKQHDWVGDAVSGFLIDTAQYTFSASHLAVNDIPVGARVLGFNIVGKSMTSTGGCMANNVSLTNVTGNSVEALVLYFNSGTESSSRLIVYMDTLPGLPFTPSNGSVLLAWNSDGNGIFRL